MRQLFPASSADPRLPSEPSSIYDRLHLPPPPAHRPYTILNMVSTVDGKITLDGARVNEIGSDLDHQLMVKLRVPVDAVVRGAGTVWSHGRYPSVGEREAAARQAAGRSIQPKAVIVTGSGTLPLTAPVFQSPPSRPIVITRADLSATRRTALSAVADVIAVGHAELDLPEAMARLRRDHDITYMLSEGGSVLNYTFLKHGLLDEIFWTVAPKIGGSREDATLVSGPHTLIPLPLLELVSAYHYRPTGELYLRYRVVGSGLERNG